MIKIWFEDIAWINGNNETIPMNYANEIIANARLVYEYKPPTIIEDTWNGKSFPVQIINNEGYSIQFGQRELSIHQIAKLQSCKKIYIHEYETNEIIEVDTSQQGQMTLEPLGRNGTVNEGFKFTFTDKKKRTIVNPGLVRSNTNLLTIDYNSSTYNYYSDYDVIDTITDTELSQYESALDGHSETAKYKYKTGKKMLFYMSEANMLLIKKHVENSIPSDVVIDSSTAIEAGKCITTLIGEGLYKCEVDFILTSNISYA
jgi:hypothetical protein